MSRIGGPGKEMWGRGWEMARGASLGPGRILFSLTVLSHVPHLDPAARELGCHRSPVTLACPHCVSRRQALAHPGDGEENNSAGAPVTPGQSQSPHRRLHHILYTAATPQLTQLLDTGLCDDRVPTSGPWHLRDFRVSG